jgi:hypothetical protein
MRCEFLHRRHDVKCEGSGAIRKEGVVPSFRFALSLRQKKGSGTPTDVETNRPRFWRGSACIGTRFACRRSTTVFSWRCRNISVQLQAMLPGTRPPRLFC